MLDSKLVSRQSICTKNPASQAISPSICFLVNCGSPFVHVAAEPVAGEAADGLSRSFFHIAEFSLLHQGNSPVPSVPNWLSAWMFRATDSSASCLCGVVAPLRDVAHARQVTPGVARVR